MKEPEIYFLKYAFPCTEGKMHRGEIQKEDLEILMDAVINEKNVGRDFLERVYSIAFKGVCESAKEFGKEPWDLETIADYFFRAHNKIIDEGRYGYDTYPKEQKEFCKVKKARIKEVRKNVCVVEYLRNKSGLAINLYVDNLEVGDFVIVHQGYVVESFKDKDSLAANFFEFKKE